MTTCSNPSIPSTPMTRLSAVSYSSQSHPRAPLPPSKGIFIRLKASTAPQPVPCISLCQKRCLQMTRLISHFKGDLDQVHLNLTQWLWWWRLHSTEINWQRRVRWIRKHFLNHLINPVTVGTYFVSNSICWLFISPLSYLWWSRQVCVKNILWWDRYLPGSHWCMLHSAASQQHFLEESS